MNLKIKQIDSTLPKPEYQTKGAVAFDLYARVQTVIKPFTPTIVPLNVIIETPAEHVLLLAARSSLPLKKNLMVANSVGIIDQDYCGENDEIGLQVLNFTQNDVIVEKGERIAQAMLVKISKVAGFNFVEQMSDESRGGFGSTG